MRWVKQLFSRRRRYDDLAVSIREHLDERIDELVDDGMSREAAAQAARREFGNVALIEERGREAWQWPKVESIWADVRYALRQLRKSPGFAITVILTMALGIGANTAIFTLVHAILMKSLPVGDPKSLYRLGDQADGGLSDGLQNFNSGDFDNFSYPYYQHLRATMPEFEHLAAMQGGPLTFSVRHGKSMAQMNYVEFVSGNYFRTLGVGTFAGRALADADDRPGAAPAVVMSYQAWQSDFGGDPSVIGATFYLESQPVTVIGIAPRGFFGDRVSNNPPAFWIPLSDEPLLRQASSTLRQPDECWLYLMGRVRPGVAIGPLQQKVSANLRQWISTQAAYVTREGIPTLFPKLHVVMTPGGAGIQDLQQQTGKELYLLLAITGFVLLVACANVANLLLARGSQRKAETSVRMALGAARARLIRQMLTESVLLGCLGGLAGLAVAFAGTQAILALAFPESPHNAISTTPSLMVLGFAFLLSLMTGVVFGIIPAWITSHSDPAEALRGVSRSGVGRSGGDRTSLPQRSLIVFQAALSLVVLLGAGLLTRSLRNLEHQDFGLQTANRYVLHVNPQDAGYEPEQLEALDRRLEEQFAAIPGMENAGLSIYSPLDGNRWDFGVYVPGRPEPGPNDDNETLVNHVSPGFLAAVGEPVIRGRGITAEDTATSHFVVVVNQAFAKKFFPKEDPIGRRFGIYDREDIGAYEIVGVVADAKYTRPREEAMAMFFAPLTQWQHHLKLPTSINLETQMHYVTSITMSFRVAPQNLYETVRRALVQVDPNLTIVDLRSLDSQLAGNFVQERLIARLTALFGLLTLVLASVGLYGITSYQVTQRTREIGLRMALGADRNRVAGLVMRGALIQVGLGLGIGVPIALMGARFVTSQLYEVKSYDPLSLFAAVVVLSTAAVVAGFFPARRAASIDPMQALRSE
jgi:predicted permease